VSNIYKNNLAVLLTSVGWGRQNRRNPGATSYAATPLCHNAFVLYLGFTSSGISVPLCSSVIPSEQI